MEITREDRIKGVLLGQACGDALGSHYEFGEPSHGNAAMKRGTFGHAPGEWTDDTSQAVAVALGRSQPETVAAHLLRWFGSNPRDVGNQTRAVMNQAGSPQDLMAAAKAFAARQAAEPRPQGWDPGTGNGSLMRTGPVCLPYLSDQVAVTRAAREISDLTHADEYSGDSCVLWSLAIESAIMTPAGFTASRVSGGLEFIPASRRGFWEAAIQEALTSPPATFWRNGSAVAAFKCALSAVAHSTGLEDGLQIAIAAGNDTDTVASIAGALLGAVHGASAVPAEWRAKIHGWPGLKAADLERLALEAASAGQER